MGWSQPITVVGFLGGFLGTVVMTALMHALADTEPLGAKFLGTVTGRRPRYLVRSGLVIQVLYGGLAGAAVPWVVTDLAGRPATVVTTLPSALAVGLVVGVALFAVMALLVRTDVTPLALMGTTDWAVFAGLHVAYGVVFAVVVGLSQDVWYPLAGL